jgi:signal transduction histidine kinase
MSGAPFDLSWLPTLTGPLLVALLLAVAALWRELRRLQRQLRRPEPLPYVPRQADRAPGAVDQPADVGAIGEVVHELRASLRDISNGVELLTTANTPRDRRLLVVIRRALDAADSLTTALEPVGYPSTSSGSGEGPCANQTRTPDARTH